MKDEGAKQKVLGGRQKPEDTKYKAQSNVRGILPFALFSAFILPPSSFRHPCISNSTRRPKNAALSVLFISTTEASQEEAANFRLTESDD
jgi:hypothetical protein